MKELELKTYTNYIEELTILRFTGKISPEDDRILSEQLAENPFAQKAFDRAMTVCTADDVTEYLASADRHKVPNWDELATLQQEKKKKRFGGLTVLTAAAVTIAFVIYVVASRIHSTEPQPVGITLKTANGVIHLSGNQTIKSGGITLENEDTALSFTVNGGGKDISTILNELVVPSGFDYKIMLSDGTLVWMNSETRLKFPFRFTDTREISITGEAYLEVAPSAGNPFLINLPGGKQVEVLGTSFNVNAYEQSESRVALVSGAVRVKTEDTVLTLKPGFEAVTSGGKTQTSLFSKEETLSWREGKFYFQVTPVKDLAKVISRWYGVKVIIENPRRAEQKFTGVLDRSQPLKTFLENADIVTTLPFKIDADGTVHIE